MDVAEVIYEGRAPSKDNQQEEVDRAIFGRNQKGGESASASNPEKGCAGKRRRNDSRNPRDAPTGAKNTCMLHGPGHYSEEWKFL